MKLRDYKCKPCTASVEELIKPYKGDIGKAYFNAVEYAKLVKLMSRDYGFNVCPFDNTVELENVGAKVEDGTFSDVPRVRESVFDDYSQLKNLPEYDFSKGRMRVSLDALEFLKDKPVMFELTGPYTFMSGLVDSTKVLKASKKDPESESEIFKYLVRNQIKLAKAASEGVTFFSIADPASGVPIVGPKIFERVIEIYLKPLISGILTETDKAIFLCPKLTLALIDLGLAERNKVVLETPMSHHVAVNSLVGKYRIFGDRCYKLNGRTTRLSTIDLKRWI